MLIEEIEEDEDELAEDFPCACRYLASISAGKVEKWARILYISALLLFQAAYWLIFLNAVERM